MPVQLWNLGSTVYSATDPSGPGSNTRRSPSVLSGPQPKQWPSHSTFMGRTIAEVAKSTSPPTSPHGGEGYVAELTAPPTSPRGGEGYIAELTAPPTSPRCGEGPVGPPGLPTRWGGTCSHFPENQALQFHAPVRCSALPLPEPALGRSASTVPGCPARPKVKTTLSDAEVFCQTCT